MTRNKAIPIKIKRVVQTGEKIQLGGLKLGLLIPAYQVSIEGVVKSEPIKPIKSGGIKEMMNNLIFCFFIFFIITIPLLYPSITSLTKGGKDYRVKVQIV